AVHADGVEHEAHGVHRGLVGRLLLAHADPACGGQRGSFGYSYELEREVAIWLAAGARVFGDLRAVGPHAGSDYPWRLSRTVADGLAHQPAGENSERPDQTQEPAVGELDADRIRSAGLPEDDPVEQDQHRGGHADDHRDL